MLRGKGDLRFLLVILPGVVVVEEANRRGINLNLLYLLLLLSIYVWLAAAVTRVRTAVLLFALLAFLALVPQKIQIPAFQDPAPVDDDQMYTATIPEGQTWWYTFTLTGLEGHLARCGPLPGTLYIGGDRLNESTIGVRLDGTTMTKAPHFSRVNGLDQMQVVPSLDGVHRFSVGLTPMPNRKPGIRLGPETDGKIVYSDSVFLELKNDNCTILYETLRRVEPSAPVAH